MEQAAQLQREQASVPDRTPEEVKRSEELGARREEATVGLRAAFDLWTAELLGLGGARHTLELNADVIVERREPTEVRAEAAGIAEPYRFFHWPLEFPNLLRSGRSSRRRPASPSRTASSTGRWSSRTYSTVSALASTWWLETLRGTR